MRGPYTEYPGTQGIGVAQPACYGIQCGHRLLSLACIVFWFPEAPTLG